MTDRYQLAQAKIAGMAGALADPVMAAFVELTEPLNALADESPGFVRHSEDEAPA